MVTMRFMQHYDPSTYKTKGKKLHEKNGGKVKQLQSYFFEHLRLNTQVNKKSGGCLEVKGILRIAYNNQKGKKKKGEDLYHSVFCLTF